MVVFRGAGVVEDVVDAVIIGAGHNGLVCAAYLAKAGLRVLILEHSHRVGGMCVTEELHPGFLFSTFAYGAHGPVPQICRDLEISRDAFEVIPTDPLRFVPFPDGDHILIWSDPTRTAASLARFGRAEQEHYPAYCDFMQAGIAAAKSLLLCPPQTPFELYEQFRGTTSESVVEAMFTRSHWDVLCEYFDHEKIRCALARADDVGYPTGVGSLLAEWMESASDGAGLDGRCGIVRGGMGRISAALAETARRFGAEIRTNCPVDQIMVEHGRAAGVRLSDGALILARIVVSNVDPKGTFFRLLRPEDLAAEFRRRVGRLKTRAGYMKYHAALAGVPRFSALPADLEADPRHVANVWIAPSLSCIERAWQDAQSGVPAYEPVMTLQLPTAYTPEIAPSGKHIFGAWVRYAPTEVPEESRDGLRRTALRSIRDGIEVYAPGFGRLVEWERLYMPWDIERETGITGGSLRHLDMTLDQMLHRRPLPPWSAYRTPVDNLYLCGAGTHPSGSVTGAPGHNAAHQILMDWQGSSSAAPITRHTQ